MIETPETPRATPILLTVQKLWEWFHEAHEIIRATEKYFKNSSKQTSKLSLKRWEDLSILKLNTFAPKGFN